MMMLPSKRAPLTPVGKPENVASLAPVVRYVISVIGVFTQTVWLSVPGSEVRVMVGLGCTMMVPLAVLTPPQSPLTLTT
jgi:hypothetical protein